jgi:hypothetical protein
LSSGSLRSPHHHPGRCFSPVWALADNARACGFYEGLGGVAGAESVERISGFCLPKVGYLFT